MIGTIRPPTIIAFYCPVFVITRRRVFILLLCSLGVRAAGAVAGVADSDLPPELAALLAAQPKWSTSVSLEGSYGYKDNLLLSAAEEERSALARGSVEIFLLKIGRGRFNYSFYAQAERTHYFSGETVDHDATAWALSDAAFRLSESLKLSVPVTTYYYDQVFDSSLTELRRDIAELKVTGIIVGPTLRWAFHRAGWLEAQVAGERKVYQEGYNDSSIGDGTFRTGWQLGERLELRLAATERRRHFDERAQHSIAGRELEGTELRIREREGEMRLDWTLDRSRNWKASTRIAVQRYEDNGSGFFDHVRRLVGHELEWTSERWLVRVGGVASRTDFLVQTVGVGTELPPRLADDYSAEVKVERKLGRRWTLLSAYSWERRRCNDPIASYRVNEGLLGARWSWER